jgi:Fic family protein
MATKKTGFSPVYTITPAIARWLMGIEAAKQAIETLPITPRVLASLRETARLFSTHYSTMIEGNRLTQEQVAQVIGEGRHFPGRERDQAEVLGYYAALDEVERLAKTRADLTETTLRKLHALVMGAGKSRVKPTPYRDGQNVIQDSGSRAIVYLPPEAADVPTLMKELVAWVTAENDLPVPLKAAVAHYQFATVHPYYDGNGRTARLLTTLILHLGGYGLKGLYALEEYYACDLAAYYKALDVGSSHNYYMGRSGADITKWVAYFIEGMARSFDRVREQAQREAGTGSRDQSPLLRNLDPKQRKVLLLFAESRTVSAREIAALFGIQQRTAAALCQRWVEGKFLIAADTSNKARRYRLADSYEESFSKRT